MSEGSLIPTTNRFFSPQVDRGITAKQEQTTGREANNQSKRQEQIKLQDAELQPRRPSGVTGDPTAVGGGLCHRLQGPHAPAH